MASQNSTNVRFLIERVVAGVFSAAERLSSDRAARLARWIFFRAPRRLKPRAAERVVLERGRRFVLEIQGERIVCWKWGRGPLVVLVHGWGGNGAQLTPLVAPLMNKGFSVAAFDAPGHGASGGGSLTIPKVAAVIARIARDFGPLHGIVAHSFGALGASFALQRLVYAESAVFIAPPSDPFDWFKQFSRLVGLSEDLRARTKSEIEKYVGLKFPEITSWEMLQEVHTPILVIHDRNDTHVPWREGERVASSAPRAGLTFTEGLGHRRILRDDKVAELVTTHLSQAPQQHCASCGNRTRIAGEMCPSCLLSEELFDRTRRWAA